MNPGLSWEEENVAGFEENRSETNLKPFVQLNVILVSLSVTGLFLLAFLWRPFVSSSALVAASSRMR